MQKNNLAIILSGGIGKRFDKSKPKQFFKLNKKDSWCLRILFKIN